MEAILFTLDAFVMVAVLYFGLVDDRNLEDRKPGRVVSRNPFRMLMAADKAAPPAKKRADLRSWR